MAKKEKSHYSVDEGGVVVKGPKATARLTVHDDGTGVVGIDMYFWSPENNPPKNIDEADERMDDSDIEGGFFWDLSPKGWKGHSQMVSETIGRHVTLEEGGVKTDWRKNNRYAEEQQRRELGRE